MAEPKVSIFEALVAERGIRNLPPDQQLAALVGFVSELSLNQEHLHNTMQQMVDHTALLSDRLVDQMLALRAEVRALKADNSRDQEPGQ